MKYESHRTAAMVGRPSLNSSLDGALGTGLLTCADYLIVTWNSGRQGDATPSMALAELMGWRESVISDQFSVKDDMKKLFENIFVCKANKESEIKQPT